MREQSSTTHPLSLPGCAVLTKGHGATVAGVFVHEPQAAHPAGILVLDRAAPEFTDAALRSSAVVVETGSRLAHLVVVCREAGIPVIRVPGGVSLFPEGSPGFLCPRTGAVTLALAQETLSDSATLVPPCPKT